MVIDEMELFNILMNNGEPCAAGLYEFPERSNEYRYCNAYKHFFEHCEFTPYNGGKLFPCGLSNEGNSDMAVKPHFSYTLSIDINRLNSKNEEAARLLSDEWNKVIFFKNPTHTVGGAGYTHSFLNYKRILEDGLNGYKNRLLSLEQNDFNEGLLLLLDGIETYRQRLLTHLREVSAPIELISALEHVPNNPPRDIYEALVSWNFMYYIDGCDDIGRLDSNLIKFHKGEDIVDILKELFINIDINSGWSGALGPDYNDLTIQCLKAIKNCRRPSIQLRITPDMPDEVWESVYESLITGCGQPALHNELLFQKSLEQAYPEIPYEDRVRMVFGGCTETMLEGISNVGSDDAGIHLSLVYDRFTRENLYKYDKFEDYYKALCEKITQEINETLTIVNDYRRTRALYRPQPVRTLFVDDCIDNQLDFNKGGARYYWSVINVSGMINVIDSLLVIRELIYERNEYDAKSFIKALDSRDNMFLKKARQCPCYGVDNDKADDLATDFANRIYDGFKQQKCYPRGDFFPVSNQFITYDYAGADVSATPDGRDKGEPLCDSLGAVHGKDTRGPTALLNSVAKLPLYRVLGTPVMNLRIKKEHMKSTLKPLVTGFFEKGGMQLQINCVSREDMLDALENPEKHENLIVRIGGYSEYFNHLSHALKLDVIKRNEY